MNPKSTLTLNIDSLSYSGGRGVGRHEGLVVFVPGTAPGDTVEVEITARKPRFLEARVVKILEPSPARREPPCPVAHRCGGCAWQHVEYPVQVEQKRKILRDSLRKIEKLQPFEMKDFLAAPGEFFYRNRIQLQVRGAEFGFFAKGTRSLVAIKKCWIAEDAINLKLQNLSRDELAATRLEIALREDGTLTLMPDRRDPEEALFSQVNTRQNERMIRAMLSAATPAPQWIFDLYCGAGNLTVPLADQFTGVPVTAVELSHTAVARAPQRPNIRYQAGDVAQVLRSLNVPAGRGLVVLDPPRPGAEAAVISEIARHRPAQIIYISCNPSTFARDVERLLPHGYRLDSVQGLDMFPQTEHVELISSLRAAT